MSPLTTLVAFDGTTRLARGAPAEVALAVKAAQDTVPQPTVYDEATGRVVDLDLTGTPEDIVARLDDTPARGPGRPKLGVVSREISLLPRHWAWLANQRGGASATLRRLIETARKAETIDDTARHCVDVTHRFLWNIAGDLPDFEEATRALFAYDFDDFDDHIAPWPADLRDQVRVFLAPARGAGSRAARDEAIATEPRDDPSPPTTGA